MRLAPLDPAAAVFLIRRARQATDLTHEPDVADSYNETRALALARSGCWKQARIPRPTAPSARRCERPGGIHRRRSLVIEAWVEFAISLSALTPQAVSELRAALPDLNAMNLANYVD